MSSAQQAQILNIAASEIPYASTEEMSSPKSSEASDVCEPPQKKRFLYHIPRAELDVAMAERELALAQLRLYNTRVALKQQRGKPNGGFIELAADKN